MFPHLTTLFGFIIGFTHGHQFLRLYKTFKCVVVFPFKYAKPMNDPLVVLNLVEITKETFDLTKFKVEL